MFVKGVEIAKEYTRCIKTIMRNYCSEEITKCCSTLIVVNEDGIICGLQFETHFEPLGFDQVNKEIVIDRKKKKGHASH
jgi:hypothetical protein